MRNASALRAAVAEPGLMEERGCLEPYCRAGRKSRGHRQGDERGGQGDGDVERSFAERHASTRYVERRHLGDVDSHPGERRGSVLELGIDRVRLVVQSVPSKSWYRVIRQRTGLT